MWETEKAMERESLMYNYCLALKDLMNLYNSNYQIIPCILITTG